MKYRIIVAALVEKEGKYLFGKKAAGVGPFPDMWLIPGGGVDLEHENLEEGLRREIREEAGIEITDIQRDMFFDAVHEKKGEMVYHIFLNYTASYASGEIRAGDDLEVVEWVEKDRLAKLEMADLTRNFLKKLNLI